MNAEQQSRPEEQWNALMHSWCDQATLTLEHTTDTDWMMVLDQALPSIFELDNASIQSTCGDRIEATMRCMLFEHLVQIVRTLVLNIQLRLERGEISAGEALSAACAIIATGPLILFEASPSDIDEALQEAREQSLDLTTPQ